MTKYTLLTATCRRTPDAITLAIGNLVHRAASKSALPAVRLEQRSDFGKAEPKPVRRGHSYLERLDQASFAFQVPVTWEGAGEVSARHVVERHAFSAVN